MYRQLSRSLSSASASSLFSRGNVSSGDLIVWIRSFAFCVVMMLDFSSINEDFVIVCLPRKYVVRLF
jgi:hypothetical protein